MAISLGTTPIQHNSFWAGIVCLAAVGERQQQKLARAENLGQIAVPGGNQPDDDRRRLQAPLRHQFLVCTQFGLNCGATTSATFH